MAPKYAFHIFVCQNERPEGHKRGCCASKDSDKIFGYLKARIKELNLENIRVNKAGCLDQCEQGPAVVIYPQNAWCKLQDINDAEQLIQQFLINQQLPKQLMMS